MLEPRRYTDVVWMAHWEQGGREEYGEQGTRGY